MKLKLRQKLFGIFVLLASLLFVAQQANAVVTISEPTAEIASSTDSNTYAFAAFTPALGSIEVVFVTATNTAQTNPTLTDGTNSWNLETSIAYGTSMIYMFWTKAANSSVTVTFTCSVDQPTGANMVIFEVAGGDIVTSNPIKQKNTATGTSTDPTVTLGAAITVTNGAMYAVGVGRSAPAYATPEAGTWTEIADTGHSSPNDGIEAADRIGTIVSTVTPTGASGTWGIIAAEVYASGAGPAPATSTSGTGLLMGVG